MSDQNTNDKCRALYELAADLKAFKDSTVTLLAERKDFSKEKWDANDKAVREAVAKQDSYQILLNQKVASIETWLHSVDKEVQSLKISRGTGEGKTSTWGTVLALILAAAALMGLFLKK